MTGGDLARAVDRLIDRIAQWTPSRWAASTASGGGSRSVAAHALAQRLADLEAGLTGRPPYPVPRLGNDLVLPDQLRVIARDLLAADPTPEVLDEAARAVDEARTVLA